ncbi:hypothetical protein ACFVUY_42775 [Kitasatospora sp. NPDC058063]|uniref:hypothetical protein n=1 Tax=unclassified Kitasatospora TaxID=2633591 RepID=UPI0036DB237E
MTYAVRNDLPSFPVRRYWLITVVVIIVVGATPWVGQPVATAALGVLTAALPMAGPARRNRRR